MRVLLLTLLSLMLAAPASASDRLPSPTLLPAGGLLLATCADFPNQAEAQAAKNTRDGDGHGVYCESLPCPCAGAGSGGSGSSPKPASKPKCERPATVQWIGFSSTKYPNIYRHFQDAVRRGWPQILAVNRPYADARRNRALEDVPTREGYDRDEYPPAVGRGKYRKALMRGTRPRGWKADISYVPDSENRSQGSVLGIKLKRFCNGTRFRYRFY